MSRTTIGICAIFCLVAACGKANLNAEQTSAAAPSSDNLSYQKVDDLVEAGDLPEEMGSCLASFADLEEYTVGEAVNYQILEPFKGNVVNRLKIKDEKVSDEARFVLVKVEASVINSVSMKLENPNAVYCIDVKADVINKVKIKSDCRSDVLQTTVEASVLNKFKYDVINEEACEAEEGSDEEAEEDNDDSVEDSNEEESELETKD